MFEVDYDDVVTILRPAVGTLGVGGAPTEWQEVLDDDDEPVQVQCAFEERGRRVLTEKGAEIQSDATMDFRGDDPSNLAKGDVIVFAGRAYEILDLKVTRLRGSSGVYGQASLKFRKDLPQAEEGP